ncbi:acetylornithine/succinylornithine family transaminase [Anaerolineae bacterium CFX9]|nr:acetylornithine/succinylornithine family transaminase [Anaerolineae bacterium CFX9]
MSGSMVPRYPFVMERGEGARVWDVDGNEYIDFAAGIAVNATGHCHPEVVRAITEQAQKFLHIAGTDYYYEVQIRLAERLAGLAPFSGDARVFLGNSGAEAVEGSIKLARWHTRRQNIIAFFGAFHGRTMGALATTATAKYRTPFEPLIGDVTFAEFNNLDSARQAITARTCGVIIEPVQGEGGVTPAEPEFLAGLRARCDEVGALLIFDEVQCGLGRTGRLWAYEHYGVTPDVMTLAKPLAGGLPMGAILLTRAVAETLEVGDHGSTFAAGPLVCAVARAVFNQINQPHFLAEVQAKGEYLEAKLREVVAQSLLLTGMRGKGLMWGLVSTIPAAEIVAEARNHGLIVLVAGEKVVRLLPPLTISREEIDLLAERLAATLIAVG